VALSVCKLQTEIACAGAGKDGLSVILVVFTLQVEGQASAELYWPWSERSGVG
jgi:hypothetical protein